MTGREFGKLVVLDRAPNTSRGAARWHCRCACGRVIIARANDLRAGKSTSCGCGRRRPPPPNTETMHPALLTVIDGRRAVDIAMDLGVTRGNFLRRVRMGWSIEDAATTGPISSEQAGRRSRRAQTIQRIGAKFSGRSMSPEDQAAADERARRLIMLRAARSKLVGPQGFSVRHGRAEIATAVDLFVALAVAKRFPGSAVYRSDGAVIATTRAIRDDD